MDFFTSTSESDVYGVKFARAEISFTDELQKLRDKLINKRIDICRVKCNASYNDVVEKMELMGLPYQLYNINYYNEVTIDDALLSELEWDSDYEYELYSSEKYESLRSLIKTVIEKKTWVNYNSYIANEILTKEDEVKATQEFICSFDSQINPGRKAWFLKYRNKYIGFFSAIEKDDSFHGILYGIMPEFMGYGHSKIIYKMMLKICAENNYRKFSNEIGVLNLPSQKSAASQFMVPEKVNLHFEIYPFLSNTTEQRKRSVIKFSETESKHVFKEMLLNNPLIFLQGSNLKTYFLIHKPITRQIDYQLTNFIPQNVNNLLISEVSDKENGDISALMYCINH